MIVYRVQDAHGRGPFKPGMSARWADDRFAAGMEPLPTCWAEFGDVTRRLGQPGEHYGCGVRSPDAIARWFSPTEAERLKRLGYKVVALRPERVLAESPNQLVFARLRPLRKGVTTIPWDAIYRLKEAAHP